MEVKQSYYQKILFVARSFTLVSLCLTSILLFATAKPANLKTDAIATRIDLPKAVAAQTQGVPVLMYHDFSRGNICSGWGCETERNFADQMKYLKEQGYTTISFQELVDYLAGNRTLSEKSIVLSFDDGYLSHYAIAYPILKKYGFKGSFAIITNCLEGNYMSWQQIKELSDRGMEIISHTVTHQVSVNCIVKSNSSRSLTKNCDKNKLKKELTESKQILSEKTNRTVDILVWPGDAFNEETIALARQSGYIGTVMAKSTETKGYLIQPSDGGYGLNQVGKDSQYKIKRLTVGSSSITTGRGTSLETFKQMLATYTSPVRRNH